MTTAIVIPSFNGLEYLKANLPSVLKLGAGEVVIHDDASTDGTLDYLKSNFPQFRLLSHTTSQRFPKSVNAGIALTSADVIFLINQDVKPQADLIKKTLPYFKDPKLFAVSFNEAKYGWAKVEFTRGFLQYTSAASTRPHASFWASGGSCAIRKSIWDQLGGFDPVFTPGYHEDLDIGWRARKQGFSILWLPGAKVDHVREATFPKTFSPIYLQHIKDRNYLICQWKNLDTKNLLANFGAVFARCLRHPGYAIPVMMAKLHLLHILAYRQKNAGKLLSDTVVFDYEINH